MRLSRSAFTFQGWRSQRRRAASVRRDPPKYNASIREITRQILLLVSIVYLRGSFPPCILSLLFISPIRVSLLFMHLTLTSDPHILFLHWRISHIVPNHFLYMHIKSASAPQLQPFLWSCSPVYACRMLRLFSSGHLTGICNPAHIFVSGNCSAPACSTQVIICLGYYL